MVGNTYTTIQLIKLHGCLYIGLYTDTRVSCNCPWLGKGQRSCVTWGTVWFRLSVHESCQSTKCLMNTIKGSFVHCISAVHADNTWTSKLDNWSIYRQQSYHKPADVLCLPSRRKWPLSRSHITLIGVPNQ